MGVVKRQSIKQSLIIYIGVLIGFLNTFCIYPQTLSPEELGLFRALIFAGAFFPPFIFMGGSGIVVRFFPEFKDDQKGNNGFLFFLVSLQFFGFLVFLSLVWIFQEQFFSYYSEKNDLLKDFLIYLFPLLFLIAYANLFTSFTSNFRRIAVPAIFNELIIKIGVPVAAGLYYFEIMSFTGFIQSLVVIYSIVVLGLIGYLKKLGQFNLRPSKKLFSKDRIKRMSTFAGYGLLGSLGGKFIDYIDTLMLVTLSTLDSAGIYSIPLLICNVIDVPRRSISRISSPILATKWKENDKGEIESLYTKSSLIQLIAGAAIMLLIWAGIDELYAIMPNGTEYDSGKYVFLILGFARLIDMATGLNSEIINYSPFFRWNFYLILLLAVFNIGANYLLIPLYDIHGAAFATLCSLALYNFAKYIVVWKKIGSQPFTYKTLEVFIVFILLLVLATNLPSTDYNLFDLIWQPGLMFGLFAAYLLIFKPSEDINNFISEFIDKIRTLKIK